MQPPENEGWAANLVYLTTVCMAALVAWVSQYLEGHRKEPRVNPRKKHLLDESANGQTVILEGAELADMQAVRRLAPELSRIGETLKKTYEVVQNNHRIVEDNHRIVEDNHRIVEQNREMLMIMQRLERDMDLREEVREHDRQKAIDDFIAEQKREKTRRGES